MRFLGGLQDLRREHGFEPLAVTGRLPAGLRGTLYRVGPALFSSFGDRYQHWFDGDGAVSALRFPGDGTASGAVRLVQSDGLQRERAAARRLYGNYGMRAPGRLPPILQLSKLAKNTGNTATMIWQSRLFALMEAALPTELDPDTLLTKGATDLAAFAATATAHPHYVPARRASYAFGIGYTTGGRVRLVELPDAGPARHVATVKLPYRTMIHDFAVTSRYAIFFVAPVVFDVMSVLFGKATVTEALRWEPRHGTTVLIVPLDEPKRVRHLEAEPFWAWHIANAFEDRDDLVIDAVRYADFASNAWLGGVPRGEVHAIAPGLYTRMRLPRAGSGPMRSEVLWQRPCDFPRIAPGAEGAPHEAVFVAANAPGTAAGMDLAHTIARLEPATGKVVEHDFGPDAYPSEPIATPDGHLLTLVYDATRDASRVVVLDAVDPSRGPIAEAAFDQPIPLTFHGAFAPR